ncbi:hypothetical protein HAX54_046162, partial [Datura stramonium]|nr:hypothetical protein [Datura stramonium]
EDEEDEKEEDGTDVSLGLQDVLLESLVIAHSLRCGAGSSADVVPQNDEKE